MTTPNVTANATASNNHAPTETRSAETERRVPRRMKPRRTFAMCPSLLRCRSKWSIRWSIPKRQRCMEFFFDGLSTLLEWFVYGIGPLLILLALSIMLELSYTFFYILLPMFHHKYLHSPFRSMILFIHCTIVTCILINILFNYACCVIQKHTGQLYNQVIQEYAALAEIALPSTPQELATYRRDLIERLSQRLKQLESDTPAETSPRTKPPRAWMLLGPHEWGFCSQSQQVKPPRAHYDHVTKSLVLNLDHYCPWMFNASVSYFVLLSCSSMLPSPIQTHMCLFCSLLMHSWIFQLPLLCQFLTLYHVGNDLWRVPPVGTLFTLQILVLSPASGHGTSVSLKETTRRGRRDGQSIPDADTTHGTLSFRETVHYPVLHVVRRRRHRLDRSWWLSHVPRQYRANDD
jgi:hypothetical protein